MGQSALTLIVGLCVREQQEQAPLHRKGSQELQCLNQCIICNRETG